MLNFKTDKLVIIDMNNGFVNQGALSSPNVAAIVPMMQEFVIEQIKNQVEIVHYSDWHSVDSLEFKVYPPHCIKNTEESQIISELDFTEINIVHKNSTNGFLTQNPFLSNKNIFIIGCVTDICVHDFAYTAIKYVQEHELNLTVNIIENLCATFDAPNHNASEVHQATLQKLQNEGVNIISN